MRVLALVPSLPGHSPGQRSSIELWSRVLEKAGIHIELAPFETPALRDVIARGGHAWVKVREVARGFLQRLRTLGELESYDAVFIYREAALLGPALLEQWVAFQGKPIIYQLDDPLYIPYVSPANGYLSYLKFFGKVATICRLSRTVIVNAPAHRHFAARFNRNVREIPSLVDGDVYQLIRRPRRDKPCIGWSGSSTTASNLSLVVEPLRELSRRRDFDLHLIGASRTQLPGLAYTAQDWQAETEVADLRRLDIGLLPLPDNPWNRTKFYLKLVQYMALGIVPVATPLGSNPEIIEHGVTGFLASSPEEWVEHLERLVLDDDLRATMSRKASKSAHARFTLEAQAAAVVEAFRSASPV